MSTPLLRHKRARDQWGYGRDEKLSSEDLILERYRGIRPAPGYPASPDHADKCPLFVALLQAEKNIGIQVTETLAMYPAASVSGLYFSQPESTCLAVGRIDREQVTDYHRRKGMELKDVERWLGPYLNYEPRIAFAAHSGHRVWRPQTENGHWVR